MHHHHHHYQLHWWGVVGQPPSFSTYIAGKSFGKVYKTELFFYISIISVLNSRTCILIIISMVGFTQQTSAIFTQMLFVRSSLKSVCFWRPRNARYMYFLNRFTYTMFIDKLFGFYSIIFTAYSVGTSQKNSSKFKCSCNLRFFGFDLNSISKLRWVNLLK